MVNIYLRTSVQYFLWDRRYGDHMSRPPSQRGWTPSWKRGSDTKQPPITPLLSAPVNSPAERGERGKRGSLQLQYIKLAAAARYVPTVRRKLPGQIVRFGEFGGICPNSRFGKPQTNGISQHPKFSTVNGWDCSEERQAETEIEEMSQVLISRSVGLL